MPVLANFPNFVNAQQTAGAFTYFKIGGPAEAFVQPRAHELTVAFRECYRDGVPIRVLGGGCNLLVHDEGVSGAVLRLSEPAFTTVAVEGRIVKVGAGRLGDGLDFRRGTARSGRPRIAGRHLRHGRRRPDDQRRRPLGANRPVGGASKC